MIDVVRPCGTCTLVRLRGYTQGFKTESKTTNEVRQHQKHHSAFGCIQHTSSLSTTLNTVAHHCVCSVRCLGCNTKCATAAVRAMKAWVWVTDLNSEVYNFAQSKHTHDAYTNSQRKSLFKFVYFFMLAVKHQQRCLFPARRDVGVIVRSDI